MRRLHRFIAGVCLVMATAEPASARELALGGDVMLGGDNNILNRQDDKTADGVFRVDPYIRVEDEAHRLRYQASYTPQVWVFMTSNVGTRADHYARGMTEYKFSPVSSLQFTARGYDTSNLGASLEVAGTDVIGTEEFLQARRQAALLTATYSHSFNRQWSSNATVGFEYYGFDQFRTGLGAAEPVPTQASNRSGNGSVNLSYSLNARTAFGVGAYGAYQRSLGERVDGDGAYVRVPSTTGVARAYFSFVHDFSSRTHLTAQVGPSYSRSEQDDTVDSAAVNRYVVGPARVGGVIDPNNPGDFFAVGCSGSLIPCLLSIDNSNPVPVGFQNERIQVPYTGSPPGVGVLTNWTYYANVEASHEFSRRVRLSAVYDRSEFAGAFEGSASTLDRLALNFRWQPDDEWSITGNLGWWQRESVDPGVTSQFNVTSNPTPPPGLPANVAEITSLQFLTTAATVTDTTQYSLRLGTNYRLTKRMSVGANLTYLHTDRDSRDQANTTLITSTVDSVRGFVVFSYDFREFRF